MSRGNKRTARDRLPEVEAALREMFGKRPTHAQIAAVLGLTRGRVTQIKSTPRPLARAESTDATRLAIMRARADLDLGRDPMLIEVAAAAGMNVQSVSRAYRALGLDTQAGRIAVRDQRRAARAREVAAVCHPDPVSAVLIVDDSRVVRRLGGSLLARAGYTVHAAEDGEVGLRLFRRHMSEIVAVILDVEMPVMAGDEVYIHLSDMSPNTPVVISTSRTRDEVAGLALSAAAGFVQKPWTANELLAELRRVGANPSPNVDLS